MADVGIKITALDNTKAAFDSVGRGLGTIKTSAAGVAGALASIGVGVSLGGFVAMTKQIMDGLDAMNDLKDATGASIENISALEDVALRTGASFDTVSTALIKLNQGLSNAKAGSDTEAAITAIGLSVKDLKALDPAEAFQRIAVGLSGFADDANKARIVQELFGKSLKEVAPLLKDVAEAGGLVATVTTEQAERAEYLNKQLFNMQASALGASRAFVNELIPTLSVLASEFTKADQSGGSMAKTFGTGVKDALEAAVRVGAGAAFVFKSIAREVGGVVAGLSAMGEGGGVFSKEGRAAWAAVWDARGQDLQSAVKDYNDLINRVSGSGAPAASVGDDNAEIARLGRFKKKSIGGIPDKGSETAAAKGLADYNRELAAQAKLIAEINGLNGSFAEDWDRLAKIYAKGGMSLEQLTAAQAKLLAGQPGIKAYNDAELAAAQAIDKANKAAYDSRLKHIDTLGAGLDKLQQETQSLQDYADRLGLSKEAIAALDAARLESQAITLDLIAIKKLDKDLDQEQYELYKAQAAELRKQAALKVQGASKEAQLDIEKEISAERKRGWQETDNLAREVFSTWANDGSSAAQKIGDTLKKALASAIYEATLKPLVFQMYTSVAGGGGASSALQAASGANGISGISSLFSAGGAISSGISNVGAAMINGPFSSLVGDLGASLVSNSAAIAGAIPYVGAALLAIRALTGNGQISAADAGRARIDYTAAGIGGAAYSTTGDYAQIDTATKAANALEKTYMDVAKALGAKAVAGAFEVGYNTGASGANPNTVIGANFGTSGYSSGEVSSKDTAAVQLAASRAVFAALQGSELPAYLAQVFNGITAGSATQDQINTTLAYATSLKTVRDAMLETRTPLEVLQATVTSSMAALGTSAETFKADFIAAIDAGIAPENLAAWQALGANLDAASESAKATAAEVSGWQDKIDLLNGKVTQTELDRARALESATDATRGLINVYYDLVSATKTTEAALQIGGNAAGGGWTVNADGDIIASAQMMANNALNDPNEWRYQGTVSSYGGPSSYSMQDAAEADGAAATAAAKVLADAAEAAAKALGLFQSALGTLTDTNITLQAKMLDAQGDTAGAYALTRQRELAKITAGFTAEQAARLTAQYDANKALSDQIDAYVQTQADAAKATADAASAAESLQKAWASITDGMLREVDRIRGVMAASSSDSLAALQSRFLIATAQARAGDQTAAGNLSSYSSQLLDSAASSAGSRIELIRMQAQVAQSLQDTAQVLGAPVQPTITPPAINTEKLEASIASLSAEIVSLKGQLGAIQTNTRRTADAVNGAGEAPMVVEIDA